MKGIQKVEIQEVSVKDPKTFIQKFGKDKGKEGQLWNVGLKIDGDWYNGALFDKAHVDAMEQRSEAELYFYEEEYNGTMYQKWRPVKDKDRENDEILKRLEALEKAIFETDQPDRNPTEQSEAPEGKPTKQSEQPNEDAEAQQANEGSEPQPNQLDDLPF